MKHGSVARARSLRRRQTAEEEVVWERLRDRRFFGFKFRRQVPFGVYTLDFYCEELKIAVELDSPSHVLHARRDAIRDRYLRLHGVAVIRLMNEEVVADRTRGMARLEMLLRERYAARVR